MNALKMSCLLFFSCIALPLTLVGQCTLTIEINGLQNNKGQVLLELSDGQGVKIKGISQTITGTTCIIVIENLKPGNYAFKYFHDENKNSTLDTNWIGIPTEGYGFSNNAEGTFGPPSFEKTIFEIKKNMRLTCKPTYF